MISILGVEENISSPPSSTPIVSPTVFISAQQQQGEVRGHLGGRGGHPGLPNGLSRVASASAIQTTKSPTKVSIL